MKDHSYSSDALHAMVGRGDFHRVPEALREQKKADGVADALASAKSCFANGLQIDAFHLKGKAAYRLPAFGAELVIRKLTANIRRLTPRRPRGRAFAISNITHFLREGVPYRVYRLDVKAFYESFTEDDILTRVNGLEKLSPQSKNIFRELMLRYKQAGGRGIPRGLQISAVLADLLMQDFDRNLDSASHIYFFYRYVDDIVIITNRTEDPKKFLKWVANFLPTGLVLNEAKTAVVGMDGEVLQKGKLNEHFSFEYLGYQFKVRDPSPDKNIQPLTRFRDVRLEIAQKKLERLKSRIVRTLRDFERTGDATLVAERIKYLTSNYTLREHATGKRKLAGIYFSYPQLSPDSWSLQSLDWFLKQAVLSRVGRASRAGTAATLTGGERRTLLQNSFVRGHSSKAFVHFHRNKMAEIQRCWKYE